MSFFRRSSKLEDQTHVSHNGNMYFTAEPPWKSCRRMRELKYQGDEILTSSSLNTLHETYYSSQLELIYRFPYRYISNNIFNTYYAYFIVHMPSKLISALLKSKQNFLYSSLLLLFLAMKLLGFFFFFLTLFLSLTKVKFQDAKVSQRVFILVKLPALT